MPYDLKYVDDTPADETAYLGSDENFIHLFQIHCRTQEKKGKSKGEF